MINYVTINNIRYYVEDGVAINDKATEELDTLTFRLTNIQPLQIEPFMDVVVYFNNNTSKSFIVNTWIDEVATFSGLKNYTISCISETKKLERVAMPNMTITQPLGFDDSKKRKYNLYLQRAMRYINKVYPNLQLSDNLISKMEDVIAVEEQFNSPNSKEYFNSILEKIISIVKVENNEISYFDLSSKGNAIDERKILFTNNAQTIEDYYSDIVTDVQGVQSEDSTIFTEIVGVRAPNDAVLTTDNAVVQVSHNINYIKRLSVYAKINHRDINHIRVGLIGDDFSYVCEKSEYDTKLVSNRLDVSSSDYKRMNIYYTRGSNVIEGLNYNEKTWFINLESLTPAIENIIYHRLEEEGYSGAVLDGNIRDLVFEITYSALDDVSTKFEKEKNTLSQIRDNQSDSYVDLDKFAKTQKEKINRLGNPTLEINARYTDLIEVPALMDYLGDYVLAEREIVYHRHYIDFKGVLYKDYVKKNLFYGVNAKKRSTQLLMGNEAVTRKELVKETYELSFENKNNPPIARYLLGKISANDYIAKRVGEDGLVGEWRMNDNINFEPIYVGDEESVYINGNFLYRYNDTYLPIVKIELYYNPTTSNSNRIIYWFDDSNYEEVYDGQSWSQDYYKNLNYRKTLNQSFEDLNTINVNDFLDFLVNNATPTFDRTLPLDSLNQSEYDFKPIKLVYVTSFTTSGGFNYKMEPDVRKADKSVTINLKWTDNINVGMKIAEEKAVGGYAQQYVTYTDRYGEVNWVNVRFSDKVNYIPDNANIEKFYAFPQVPDGYRNAEYEFYENSVELYKDNREILNITFQFDFKTEDNIFITDKFINYLPLFERKKEKLKVYVSNQDYYNKYNCTRLVGTSSVQNNITIDYTNFENFIKKNMLFNSVSLYNNNVDLSRAKSWALADDEGNVYIAVNKRESDAVIPTTIYLNKKGE